MMKLRKVAELPSRSYTSKYDKIVEQVRKSPGQWFALDGIDVEDPGALAQELKSRYEGIRANTRSGVLYIRAD